MIQPGAGQTPPKADSCSLAVEEKKKGERGEKPRGIEEGSRPSGRLAGETACPTASIRFFMKFRGRSKNHHRPDGRLAS
jgi:hypothetical protein